MSSRWADDTDSDVDEVSKPFLVLHLCCTWLGGGGGGGVDFRTCDWLRCVVVGGDRCLCWWWGLAVGACSEGSSSVQYRRPAPLLSRGLRNTPPEVRPSRNSRSSRSSRILPPPPLASYFLQPDVHGYQRTAASCSFRLLTECATLCFFLRRLLLCSKRRRPMGRRP